MTEEIKTTETTTENTVSALGLSPEELEMIKRDLNAKKVKQEQEQKLQSLMADEVFKAMYDGSETFRKEIDSDMSYLNNEKALGLLIKSAKQEMLKPKEEPKPATNPEPTRRPMYQTAVPNQQEKEIREGDKRTTREVSADELTKLFQNTYGVDENTAKARALNFKILRG